MTSEQNLRIGGGNSGVDGREHQKSRMDRELNMNTG
jgi:hypothetical protein